MTFLELVNEVTDRLNLTSDQAISRVGREINSRYKRVTSSIGLVTSRRLADVAVQTVTDNRYLTFTGIEKVLSVLDVTDPDNPVVLVERGFDEMNTLPLTGGQPRNYAVSTMGANYVIIYVDSDIVEDAFIKADGLELADTLSGSMTPAFAESFHDALVFGAVADELRKMEKIQLAKDAEEDFERRVSDLRMFIAVSGFKDIYQGKTVESQNWWRDKWV